MSEFGKMSVHRRKGVLKELWEERATKYISMYTTPTAAPYAGICMVPTEGLYLLRPSTLQNTLNHKSLPPLPRTGRRTTAPVRTPSPLMIGTSGMDGFQKGTTPALTAFQGTPFHEAHRKIPPDGVHGDLERRPVSTAPPTSTLAALFPQGPGL
ncbi:hypothetical protein CMUS01_08623 [Colletotrichum musicola]|uniref:Uncharacterized protein n=1 Tax=Colletotrichum musicola TaxID=2175873 RepID=A0A8H6ND02_9PEZI|nr:hypothetical protein CMUS01_08623 [Colletotrichum musicola]